MECTAALEGFLNEPTAGLLLVAGLRGIGQTTFVRHWAHRLQRPLHLVDAADLGLYQRLNGDNLERTLPVGLFRALCDPMIPHATAQAEAVR